MSFARPLLIVKTGSLAGVLSAESADFDERILAGMGCWNLSVTVCRVDHGATLPPPAEVIGVVVTGSAAMVSDRLPWAERTAQWLAGAASSGVPVLGICFGHQLMAHALGGRSGPNPRGREIGTVPVRLTAAAATDPLLGGLPEGALVQTTHVESVLTLPPGAVLLAASERDPHQAFRCGERAWGVQFHPELDAAVVRAYVTLRREAILGEGLDPDAILAATLDTPHGAQVLARFAAIVRGCG